MQGDRDVIFHNIDYENWDRKEIFDAYDGFSYGMNVELDMTELYAYMNFGVTPDVVTLGKVVGGGLPLAAVGGRRKYMKAFAPEGPVYQAGTLAGNPIAVAAGLKTLEVLGRDDPYPRMAALGSALAVGVSTIAAERGIPVRCQSVNGVFTMFCSERPVTDLETAKTSDTKLYARIFHGLLDRGIYVAPSQFECNFVSAAHTERDIDEFLDGFAAATRRLSMQ